GDCRTETFLKRGAFRKVWYPPPRRHARCTLCPSGGQPSQTGKCCEAESPLPTLAFSKRPHLLMSAAAYRTATAADRWPPPACGVAQYLSSCSFYGVVVQRSCVSKGCAWGAGASSPCLCGRTLAWHSDRVGRGRRHGVHCCLGGTRCEHLCGQP